MVAGWRISRGRGGLPARTRGRRRRRGSCRLRMGRWQELGRAAAPGSASAARAAALPTHRGYLVARRRVFHTNPGGRRGGGGRWQWRWRRRRLWRAEACFRIPGNVSAPRPPHSSARRLARASRAGGGWGAPGSCPQAGERAPRREGGVSAGGSSGRGALGSARENGGSARRGGLGSAQGRGGGARAGGREARRCLGAGETRGRDFKGGSVRDAGCCTLQLLLYPTKGVSGRLPTSRSHLPLRSQLEPPLFPKLAGAHPTLLGGFCGAGPAVLNSRTYVRSHWTLRTAVKFSLFLTSRELKIRR